MLPSLLLALACSRSDPKTLLACDDVECMKRVAVQQWTTDQATLLRDIEQLRDPIEQVVVIEALMEAHPGQSGALCPLLSDGPGRERCERINMRPHLASRGSTATAEASAQSAQTGESARTAVDMQTVGAAQGPGMTLLIPTSAAAFAVWPWEGLAATAVDCGGGISERTCRTNTAISLAQQGKDEEVAAVCAGIEAGQWRWECMFDASEAAAGVSDGAGAAASLKLCLGTGEFVANCLAHAAMGVATVAPPANVSAALSWAPILSAAKAAEEAFAQKDPDLADRLVDRIWAESLASSYRRVDTVTGDPFDLLPDRADPHIRGAAIWRLVELEGSQTRTLAEWEARVNEVLAARTTGLAPAREAQRGRPVNTLWQELYPGEEVFEQVLFLGQAKRALAEDPKADALVCLLESIARSQNRPAELFVEALSHASREVRWTSARLIQSLDSSGVYRARAAQSEDPLVRGRSVFRVIQGAGPGGQAGGAPTGQTGP